MYYRKEDLKAWNDGCMYYNSVFDEKTNEIRNISETEKLITQYCFSHQEENELFGKIGYQLFEHKIYSEKNLRAAGKTILDYESSKKGRKNAQLKYLLEKLPSYLAQNNSSI